LLQKIGDLKNNFLSKLHDMWSSVTSFFAGLPAQGAKWMSDFINSLVQGLENGIKSIGQAAQNIGSTISNFLHFSVPEEGPLVSAPNWMKDFMLLLASGIEEHQGLVANAAQGMALNLSSSIQAPLLAGASSVPAIAASPPGVLAATTGGQAGSGTAPALLSVLMQIL